MTSIRLFFLSLLCCSALSTLTAQGLPVPGATPEFNHAILPFNPGEMTKSGVEDMLQRRGYPGEVIDKAEVFGLFLIQFDKLSFEGMDCDKIADILKAACPKCKSPTTTSSTSIQGGGGLNYETSASFADVKNQSSSPSNTTAWLNSWAHLMNGGSKEDCPVKVAFLDSGIDPNHLSTTPCFNRTTTATIPQFTSTDDDIDGHGTHTIGVAAQMVENYPNISLLSIKTQNEQGKGTVWTAIKGLERALGTANPYLKIEEENEYTEEKADIVNMSLMYAPNCVGEYEQPLATAMRICMDNYNMMIITAAGNQESNLNSPDVNIYPSKFNLPYQINVAALDPKGSLVTSLNPDYDWGTNYGNLYADIALLGVDVPSYLPSLTTLENRSGTSAATPQMTALVAMLKSKSCSKSNEEIIECIKSSIKPAKALDVSVQGYLQSEEALACAKERFKIQGRVIQQNQNTYTIYPNPFNEALNLEITTQSENEITQCTLYNLTGQIIQKADFQGNINTTWEMNDLAKGVYLLKIQQGDTQEIRKLIKQ